MKEDKKLHTYFVSFTLKSEGVQVFGNTVFKADKPIKTKEDMEQVTQGLTEMIKEEDPETGEIVEVDGKVVILNLNKLD